MSESTASTHRPLDINTPIPQGDGSEAIPEAILLGLVAFDNDSPDSMLVRMKTTPERWKHFRREMYVGIRDAEKDIEFLGRVIEGPFYSAGKAHHASNPAEANGNAAHHDPAENYYLHGTVEVLGQLIGETRLLQTHSRPRPGSAIYVFPIPLLRRFLDITGDLFMGHLAGHAGLDIRGESDDKNFLPRNLGIFGTVGSGKSNTAQVLIEEATAAGWAVVVIDVEGEYVRMNEPTEDARLIEILDERFQQQPQGIDDFHVYVPSAGTTDAESPVTFKIPISALHTEIVADILEFSESELRVFGMITEQAAAQRAPDPTAPGGIERPYDLQYLIDGLGEGPSVDGNPTIRLLPFAPRQDVLTAGVLRSKLNHLGRSGMLDLAAASETAELPVDELVVPGRLSVLDVSETDDRSRNLAIAFVLQELFDRVIKTPKGEPMASGTPRPPLLVVIEEVHTFISRTSVSKMKSVLDALQTITRRGRKRWMGLALVSQQPNHVPNEIFELANTRFIHQLKSQPNIEPVRQTTGGVGDEAWALIPGLQPGQCLLTSPLYKNAMFVDMRPARSRRMLVT